MAPPAESELTFRRVELRDVGALVKMRFSLLYESHFAPEDIDRESMEESFRTYFTRHIPTGEFTGWVAEAGGIVVGTGGMVLWHKPPLDMDATGREAYIMNMYTLPDWRARGIAGRLMDLLIEDARTAGIRRIRLHASEAGARVYKTKGFKFNPSDMVLRLP